MVEFDNTRPKLLVPVDMDAYLHILRMLVNENPRGYILQFSNGKGVPATEFRIDKFSLPSFPQMLKDSGWTMYKDEHGDLILVEELDITEEMEDA